MKFMKERITCTPHTQVAGHLIALYAIDQTYVCSCHTKQQSVRQTVHYGMHVVLSFRQLTLCNSPVFVYGMGLVLIRLP